MNAMTINLDLVLIKNVALLIASLVLSCLMAFKGTRDLDEVKNRFVYRMALVMMYSRGMLFTFESLGWITRVR